MSYPKSPYMEELRTLKRQKELDLFNLQRKMEREHVRSIKATDDLISKQKVKEIRLRYHHSFNGISGGKSCSTPTRSMRNMREK